MPLIALSASLLIVSEPSEVVTVQSASCAFGLDKIDFTTTWFEVSPVLEIVSGRLETEFDGHDDVTRIIAEKVQKVSVRAGKK